MPTIPLQAQARSQDAAAKTLRRENRVPCVLYGNDVDNTQLTCDYSELFRVYSKAGESVIVELEVGSKKVPVLFHALQFEPVSDRITHVDFFAVDMKKEIEARVPLNFIGESEAVKSLGGVLVTVMDHVTVKCLPVDLPQHLDISIEPLVTFADAVSVVDIVLPKGVTITDAEDARIATVQEPRREEVVATAEEGEGEREDGEATEGKAEGEAPAEGEEKKEEGGEAKSE